MKYFKVDNASYNKGYYTVTGTDSFYNYFKWTDGSYKVFYARIMGLTYPSYLRMVRNNFSAELSGKGHKYPSAYFKNKDDAERLASTLDKRLEYLINKFK